MSFKCEVIADSKSPQGDRLTTFVVTFPRIVLAEFNTHRMFSRNSASSRAIPFKTMLKKVQEEPFIPIAWQKDHKGMQGTEYFTGDEAHFREVEWLGSSLKACQCAEVLHNQGATKQLCNRLLEPFMYHTVIFTTSEEGLENFFNLRCPQYKEGTEVFRSKKDQIKYYKGDEPYVNLLELRTDLQWLQNNKSQAEIHIQKIAEMIWDDYNKSTPKQLETGEYHIPFGDKINESRLDTEIVDSHPFERGEQWTTVREEYKIQIATARCARVSYLNYEGKDDYEADIKLFDRLSSMEHFSPFEHVAKAMSKYEYESYQKKRPSKNGLGSFGEKGWCRNFKGFIQLRELVN